MHRQREWDAVGTVEAPGTAGDEAWLVVFPDGRVLVEEGLPGPDPAVLAGAVRLEAPFRAHAVRRERVWAVAARRIDVVELDVATRGNEIELAWTGTERTVRVDREPTLLGVPELERLASARFDTYVVTAQRLDGSLWEVAVSAL